jgi:hypothetical protein
MFQQRINPWLAVAALTLALTAISTQQALTRYDEFRSGFSWDLAYYNQWFWAITRGDGMVTVRPLSAYAEEGPSVWKMNYLAPIRFALVPIYALVPGPRTLLVIQNVIFWLVVAAAYTLVRAESQSAGVALSAAVLAPLTPLLWPLVLNDFRELQLAIPFVLWAIQGWRERQRGLAALGITGMLACRQEYAVIVALLALVPARRPEAAGRRRRWTQTALVVGIGWFVVVFLGYLAWRVGPHAPADYLTQAAGVRGPIEAPLVTALDFLVIGLGSWTLLALFAPWVAALAVPWLWSLASGQFGLRTIETIAWHHVRYAAPLTALMLAAGLIGYARIAGFVTHRFEARSPRMLIALWSVSAVGLLAASIVLGNRFARVPRPIPQAEAGRLWFWITQVDPGEGVLTAYEVAAPLSSRRSLFSYRLDENKPPGYPRLAPEIHWAFVREAEVPAQLFINQGFVEVSAGPSVRVFRRTAGRTGRPSGP